MAESVEVKDLLDHMARRFEDAAQFSEQSRSMGGWGQFLDAPKHHRQIGPYGTSAGIIVLALADRGQSDPIQRATNQLYQWWKDRDKEQYVQKRFVQTTRLAMLHLALRLSGVPDVDKTRSEVEKALIDRLLPSGMWGNYWLSKGLCDPTPRLFPSAIALLSFTLFRNLSDPVHEQVISAADRLEEKLTLSRSLPPLEAAAASVAIVATKGATIGRRASARMASNAIRSRTGLSERGDYFYDYEYFEGDTQKSFFGRDYFIVPTGMLLGIAGFQFGAPSTLRLLAETSLNALTENLRKNDGAYRPAEGERMSTVDQAWSAILLKVSSVEHTPPRTIAKIWYWLIRHRQDNWFTRTVIPIFSMLMITAIDVLVKDMGPIINVFAAAGTLIIGGLYGDRVVRRLFPGRE